MTRLENLQHFGIGLTLPAHREHGKKTTRSKRGKLISKKKKINKKNLIIGRISRRVFKIVFIRNLIYSRNIEHNALASRFSYCNRTIIVLYAGRNTHN